VRRVRHTAGMPARPDRIAATLWFAAAALAVVQVVLVLTGDASPALGLLIGLLFVTAAAVALARNRAR
jgi:hypothetical protein